MLCCFLFIQPSEEEEEEAAVETEEKNSEEEKLRILKIKTHIQQISNNCWRDDEMLHNLNFY